MWGHVVPGTEGWTHRGGIQEGEMGMLVLTLYPFSVSFSPGQNAIGILGAHVYDVIIQQQRLGTSRGV